MLVGEGVHHPPGLGLGVGWVLLGLQGIPETPMATRGGRVHLAPELGLGVGWVG